MALPFIFTRPPSVEDKPSIVQVVSREDVLWNRPVFRAPPLKISPPNVQPEVFKILATPAVPSAVR
jgi:hypothetical protein